jgi:hypothetical protein
MSHQKNKKVKRKKMPISITNTSNLTNNNSSNNSTSLLKDSIANLSGRFTHLADLQQGVAQHMQALLNQVSTLLDGQNEFPVDKEDLRKLENIVQKDMPGLLDIYEKLPMTYRNEKILKNNRTHRQNCIANLMLLSGIILDIEDRTISQFDNVMAVQQHALREIYETDSLQASEVIHNHPVHEITENRDDVVQIKKPQIQTQQETEIETDIEVNNAVKPEVDISNLVTNPDEEEKFSEIVDEETLALLENLEPPTQEAQKVKSSFNPYVDSLGNNELLDNLLLINDKKLPIIKKGDAVIDNFNWLEYKNNHPELNLQTMEHIFVKSGSQTVKSLVNNDMNANDSYGKDQKEKMSIQESQSLMSRFLSSMNSFYRKISRKKDSTAEMENFLRMIKSDTFTPEFFTSCYERVKLCQDMLPRALKDKSILAPEVIDHCVMYIAVRDDQGFLHEDRIVNLASEKRQNSFFNALHRYEQVNQWWNGQHMEEKYIYKDLFDIIKMGDDFRTMYAVHNTLRFNPAFLSDQNDEGKKNLAKLNEYEYAAECLMTYYENKKDEQYSGSRHAHLKARQDAIDAEKEKIKQEKELRKMKDIEYNMQEEELKKQQDMQGELYEMLKLSRMKKSQDHGLLTIDDYDKKMHQWMYPDVDENLFVNDRGMYFENLDDAINSLKYDLEKSRFRTKTDNPQFGFVTSVNKEEYQNMKALEDKEVEEVKTRKLKI